MQASPYHAIDIYIEAAYKSDDEGMDYALSLLGSVHTTPAERRTIYNAHKRLQDEAGHKIKFLEKQIVRLNPHTDEAEFDQLVHRRDQLVFDWYMYDKLLRYIQPLL